MPASDDWRGAVLDSYAVLAYLQDEPGAETVERMLARSRPTEPTLLTWRSCSVAATNSKRSDVPKGPFVIDSANASNCQACSGAMGVLLYARHEYRWRMISVTGLLNGNIKNLFAHTNID